MNFERVRWSWEAVAGLGETMRDCEDLLRAQVERGIAELWRVGGHSWMITRTEYFPTRKPELVVCCYKGRGLKAATQIILDTAKKQGFSSVRFHTQRKGLNRLIQEADFQLMETVYYKNLEE